MAFNVFRGDQWRGSSKLRTIDACDSSKQNTYVIPSDATVEMIFPGAVSITSGAGEITIESYDGGEISWVVSGAKSATVTAGANLGIDCIITSSGEELTFEKLKIITIKDRVNG